MSSRTNRREGAVGGQDGGFALTAEQLDEPCGRHLTFRDLIEVGETWQRFRITNVPKQSATVAALRALAEQILDPVIDEFGKPEITYGFAWVNLFNRIQRHTDRDLDQHAGHELGRGGKPICPRLGQAVDFKIEGTSSHRIRAWIAANLPFDRLYLYGADRPLHVSFGPEHSRVVFTMFVAKHGERVPTKRSLAWLAEQN